MVDIREGYFKFTAVFAGEGLADDGRVAVLNGWRDRLRRLEMVGAYTDGPLAGVGYGNLSIRTAAGFLITATRTGPLPVLTAREYCEVIAFDLDRNTVRYRGASAAVTPSAECMTHGAAYGLDAAIGAVIHVHHAGLWRRLLDRWPTTSRTVEYGTPGMGHELARLYRESDLPRRRLAVMGGHEDGVVSLGRDLDEAGAVLLDAYGEMAADG